MSTSALPPPVLVADDDGLDRLVQALAPCPVVAVDTESNSLHAYRECVCLIQFSTPDADFIVDAIGLPDLSRLAPVFANPTQQKMFHAAEYDIVCLRRSHGFEFTNIFDTMSVARTLGWPKVGLAAIVDTHFGVTLSKKYQRTNWKRRPLTPAQLDYARLDTHYLLRLRDQQLQTLTESGHWPEALEEFARLARLGRDAGGLQGLPGMTPEQIRRHGSGVLQAVQQGLGAPAQFPPRVEREADDVRKRYGHLHTWRKHRARTRGVESDVILPRTVLIDLARRAPSTHEELADIPDFGPWRRDQYAAEILALLAPPADSRRGSDTKHSTPGQASQNVRS